MSKSEIAIITALNSGVCGIAFERGRSYLIAADPPERPATTTCSAGFFKAESESAFLAP